MDCSGRRSVFWHSFNFNDQLRSTVVTGLTRKHVYTKA